MKKILLTGASGNVGLEVVYYLKKFNDENAIVIAARDIGKAKSKIADSPQLSYRKFDFKEASTFLSVFENIDMLFLLRPPNISEVDKYFRPLLEAAKKSGVQQLIFLSVQGAERSKLIPHNKIEALVRELEFDFIFVRPAYFMQNLTTTLLPEIINKKSITLPSANARFNWVDVKNIGEATAKLILNFEEYQNNSYEITGTENRSFKEVTELITKISGERIRYNPVNPISFFFKKKKEGMATNFAFVITLLHYLPRLQSEAGLSENYQILAGKNPTTLAEFIEREIMEKLN